MQCTCQFSVIHVMIWIEVQTLSNERQFFPMVCPHQQCRQFVKTPS